MSEVVDRSLGVAQPGIPAWNRRKPAKYEVHGCTARCSLSVAQLGSDLAKTFHGWFEQALGDIEIGDRSDKVGHHVSYGAVARHRANHLVAVQTVGDLVAYDPLAPPPPEEKIDHISVLEQMIALGAKKLESGKLTPDIVLRAMEMHFKLTQGKSIDDTMAAIAAAMAGTVEKEEDGLEQNREAIKTPAELAEELASVS